MSRKKHTERWALEADPPLPDNVRYSVVRAQGTRGQSLHDVVFPDGRQGLCTLPPRFRNVLWVKRGHYLLVDLSEGEQRDNKIDGEIAFVLRPEQVRYIKKHGCWPTAFTTESTERTGSKEEEEEEEEDSDDDLFVNTNRRQQASDDDEASDEESD
ncbi:hypothetical protein THASP1DRAFT_27279 [Thamnocephalis sphaerospora]|uniref:S1-like domain-containing protein n=1 Tax=Thamnocephalis sphaerospora TaxID=78915 RepID=A0A4P9XZQ4_9FUNG|nr:hypothetical protein THASP1DRAFT_27279 [Thamnocephalis sphaerospora]|eukprot:RKP10970.1 hypothetical protein THASP1DRAFT_27279 [Thamnocephalis sphaerospora]